MIVVDTSALIGARRAHYLPQSMAGFWTFFEAAWEAGDLVVPLAVFDEIGDQSDELHRWMKGHRKLVLDPSQAVQKRAGEIRGSFRFRDGRDEADPFVIAEAEISGYAVTTYEGRSPTGAVARAKLSVDNIPRICDSLGVRCLQPGQAWQDAGLSL
jgi:hypothetical protein